MISQTTFNNLFSNNLSVEEKMNFDLSQSESDIIDIETRFNLNFSPKSTQEEKDFPNFQNSSDIDTISSIIDQNPMPSMSEIIPINSDFSETRNDSIFSQEKSNLFTNIDGQSILVKEGEGFLKRKRFQKRRPRKENQDNIRKKIKRGFFNSGLIKKLNEKLKKIGSRKYLRKFPQHFVSDVNQKRNKEILEMTLGEVFCKKELYLPENEEGLNNYLYNLKVIKSEEVEENDEFKKILNKTIRELYEEYINSEEFKVEEINRLKEKKMKDEYIERYISLARYLITFFTQ